MRRAAVRRAEVLSVSGSGRVEIRLLDGPLAGELSAGVFYAEFGEGPGVGEVVLANTVGLEMGLGTGGVSVLLPGGGGEVPKNRDHFVKLPYTPLQFPAKAAAERAETLAGKPVVVLALHSHLAVACCAARKLSPEVRTAFVWQEGGALAVGFSRAVRELKGRGLLGFVVSAGSCFGGDEEAANLYAGLLAAGRADLVFVGIGPGVVGSGEVYGHGGMSAALAANAAASLGARPVLAPRVSGAEARERHRGLSHHTRSALEAALAPSRVAVPPGAGRYFEDLLDDLPERHEYVPVEASAAGLEEEFGVTFASMGRSYGEDPVFFDAAVAAVKLALQDEEGA